MKFMLFLFLAFSYANDQLREVYISSDSDTTGFYEVPLCVNKIPADLLERIEKLEYHVLTVKKGPFGPPGPCVKDEEIEKKIRMLQMRIEECAIALSQNTILNLDMEFRLTWLIRLVYAIVYAMAIYVFFKTW